MSVQRRPLTGMVSSGVSAPRALGTTDGLIHQLDTLSPQQGGTYIDVVTLMVANTTGEDIEVTVIVCGGAPVVQAVPANSSLMVFDQTPFQAAANATGASTQIVGHSASAESLVFWGWFARPL